MENNLYTVMLKFDPDDQLLRQKVIQRLCQIDPTASKRLANIKHGRVVVKKNTSLATAQRLGAVLQKTGALCTIEKQPSAKHPAPPHDNESITPKNGSQQLIRCPNCKSEQSPTIECRSCGAIIEKAHRHRVKAFQEKPAEPETPETPVQTNSIVKLYQRIVTSLPAWIKKRPLKPEKLQNWWRRLADGMLSCGIVFIVALVLEIGLLYVLKMLWYVYTATNVGKYYVLHFPGKAAAIQHLMTMDMLMLAWDSTLMVLYVCLLLSIIAQFLHLIRYLFDTQGWVGKLIIWCTPTTALAAWGIFQQYHLPHYLPAIGLVLVPTLCILSRCMQMAHDTLPEIGMLWNMVANALWKGDNRSWTKIKRKLRSWIDANSG